MFDRGGALQLIRLGRCACNRCPGHLSDPRKSPNGWGHCNLCHCAWRAEPYGVPATVPAAQGCPAWDPLENDPAHRWR
jgi:hypothetical protein